jgi:hypothetical protein
MQSLMSKGGSAGFVDINKMIDRSEVVCSSSSAIGVPLKCETRQDHDHQGCHDDDDDDDYV